MRIKNDLDIQQRTSVPASLQGLVKLCRSLFNPLDAGRFLERLLRQSYEGFSVNMYGLLTNTVGECQLAQNIEYKSYKKVM